MAEDARAHPGTQHSRPEDRSSVCGLTRRSSPSPRPLAPDRPHHGAHKLFFLSAFIRVHRRPSLLLFVGRLIVALKEIVLDYNLSTHLLRRVLEARGRDASAAGTLLASRRAQDPARRASERVPRAWRFVRN